MRTTNWLTFVLFLLPVSVFGEDPVLAADGTTVEKPGSFGLAAPPQFVKLSNISKDKLFLTVYYYESQPVMTFY